MTSEEPEFQLLPEDTEAGRQQLAQMLRDRIHERFNTHLLQSLSYQDVTLYECRQCGQLYLDYEKHWPLAQENHP